MSKLFKRISTLVLVVFVGFMMVVMNLHVQAEDKITTCVAATESTLKVDATNLLKNADVAVEEFKDGEWQDKAWCAFDQNRIKITWAWEKLADGADGYPIGFYQNVKVEKNTYYQVMFTAMQYNVSGKDMHSLKVGLANDKFEYVDNQVCEIAGNSFENAQNYTYYVSFYSGENENVALYFSTTYESPVAANTFGGFFINNFAMNKVQVTIIETCVATAEAVNKVESTNLLKNADVATEAFKDGEWQDKAWCGFDQNRIKITWAWEKLADGADGYPIGFYQKVKLQKNTYYQVKFTAMQYNVSGKDMHSLKVGFANEQDEYVDGQVCEIPGTSFENAQNYTYYVTFYSGSNENVKLFFSTNYESPVNPSTFGGFFCSDFALNKVKEGAELDVTVGQAMNKSLYIVEANEENLFKNADVAITDFANADCAWKNLAWAGFDGQRVKITYAWEDLGEGKDGFDIGYYQDVEVEANTTYDISLTLLQWNLSTKPDQDLVISFADPDDQTNTPFTSKSVRVNHPNTDDVAVSLNSGDHTKVRVLFTCKYVNPNITGNFGGFFCSNFAMVKSTEMLKNADVAVEEFAKGAWENYGWAGFDGGRLKITWAWEVIDNPDFLTGFFQTLKVEKDTYYLVKFDVMEWNMSGKPQHGITVGFADKDNKYIEGQSCTINGEEFINGTNYTYNVAFYSGDNEEVKVLFTTPYESPAAPNNFGGFFFDNFSVKKIVGQADPTFDLSLTTADGRNYLYVDKAEADTLQIVPVIANIKDFGLTTDELTYTVTSVNSEEIATVSETGLVTAGTKTGPYNVKVVATYDWYGKEIKGEATIKLRVIKQTSKDVLINATEKPFETDGKNVLNNGDFEGDPMDTATTDHSIKAESWRSVIGGWMNTEAQAGYEQTTGAKITFRWQDGLTEDDWPCFYEDVNVEANTLYELSFQVYNWVGLRAGENNLIVGYRNRNGEDMWANVQDYYIASPTIGYGVENWTNITVYLYTNDLTEIRLFAACKAQAGHDGGAGWWFDNFSLEKVTAIKDTEKVVETGADIVIPATMRLNDEKAVSAYAVYSYGYHTASQVAVNLVSSDPSIVEVKDGKLIAKKTGKVNITATYGETEVVKEVTVLAIPQKVEVKVGSANEIEEGRDQKIVVTVTYSDGTTENLTNNCKFTVSDSSVIAQKGSTMYLAGKKAGKGTLTVEVEMDGYKLTGSVEVTVKGEEVEPAKKGCNKSSAVVVISSIIAGTCLLALCFKKRNF